MLGEGIEPEPAGRRRARRQRRRSPTPSVDCLENDARGGDRTPTGREPLRILSPRGAPHENYGREISGGGHRGFTGCAEAVYPESVTDQYGPERVYTTAQRPS